MNKIKYYLRCIKWLWKNRNQENNRQKMASHDAGGRRVRKKSILEGRFAQLLMLNGEFERIKEKRIDVYEHDGACYVIPTVSVEKRPPTPVADLLGFNYNYYITLCFMRYHCRIGIGRRKNDDKS